MTKTLFIRTDQSVTSSPVQGVFPDHCPQCNAKWQPFTGANGCKRAFCDKCAAQAYERLTAVLEPVQAMTGRIEGFNRKRVLKKGR